MHRAVDLNDAHIVLQAVRNALAEVGTDGTMLYRRIKRESKDELGWEAHAECPVSCSSFVHFYHYALQVQSKICYLQDDLPYILTCMCMKKLYSLVSS